VFYDKISYGQADYGRGGTGYYREVDIIAYQGNGSDYDVKHTTTCSVRESEKIPDITVEDDPSLSLVKRVIGVLSPDVSINDLKRSKRKKQQKKWNKKHKPRGPKVPVYEQLDDTVREVIDQLELQYNLVSRDIDIDVDVTVEEITTEFSQEDLDAQLEQLSRNAAKHT
jgi:hypothetical protein